jgi:5-hydroxyisourate hydrolase
MSTISTHVLDTTLGKPATGVAVRLDEQKGDWSEIGRGLTDADGRCRDLAPSLPAGIYRLVFDTGAYLRKMQRSGIYPEVSITFNCTGDGHYHLPLLLSDNSYTTYRGS